MSTAPSSPPSAISQHSFVHSRFSSFVPLDKTLLITINNVVVDSSFPVSEPTLLYESSIFYDWFGISFQGFLNTTHIRTLHLS